MVYSIWSKLTLNVAFHLRLSCDCDEGEQQGNNSFLIHIRFALFQFFQKLCKGIEVVRVGIHVEHLSVAADEPVGGE